MRFTIFGFSQKELIKYGLDTVDALLLRYFVDFKDSGRMDREEINGETYHWVRYDSIIEDLPILSLKKDTIYRRLKRMSKRDILRHETIREGGVYSYYGIGSNFIKLISNFKTNPSELNAEPYVETSITLREISPEQKINLLKDPSTKDINNIYTTVVNYLNEKAGKGYRVSSKKHSSSYGEE